MGGHDTRGVGVRRHRRGAPVVGLYAAVPALLVYAALGTSRHLVVGPMSATAMLSAGVVGSFTVLGGAEAIALTAALALVTGVLGITAGLLRLGFLASLISEPVLKGFIVGLALVIIVGQLPALLGVAGGDGNVVEREWAILTALDTLDALTAAVGMTSLVTVLLLGRVADAAGRAHRGDARHRRGARAPRSLGSSPRS